MIVILKNIHSKQQNLTIKDDTVVSNIPKKNIDMNVDLQNDNYELQYPNVTEILGKHKSFIARECIKLLNRCGTFGSMKVMIMFSKMSKDLLHLAAITF